MTAARPFIPRPKDRPAWWAEPAKPEELEAVVRERRERERRSGVRHGRDVPTPSPRVSRGGAEIAAASGVHACLLRMAANNRRLATPAQREMFA